MIYNDSFATSRNIFESVSFLNESKLEVLNEGFAITGFLKKVKEIKNARPDEYSEYPKIKEFCDKYYDDIVKAADTLEKEPEKINKAAMTSLIEYGVAFIGLLGSMAMPTLGIIVFILGLVAFIIHITVVCIRASKDDKGIKELGKIRSSLVKARNNKDLDDEYKARISKLISKIDDAESEYAEKVKVSN